MEHFNAPNAVKFSKYSTVPLFYASFIKTCTPNMGKATNFWVICAAARRENHHPRMSLLKIRPKSIVVQLFESRFASI